MRNLIVILMLLIACKVSAQSSVISYDSCIAKRFCLDCGDPKATYNGEESLSEYFKSKVDRQKLQDIKGSLYLQVIVDEEGNACLKSVSNLTNATSDQVKQLELDKVIAKMERWSPARTNSKSEISSLTLIVNIGNAGDLSIDYQRLGRISIE